MNVDTLKIYDDLKASGIPEAQAHAQATAIAHANRVTPEDLREIKLDLSSKMDAGFKSIEKDLKWMMLIGGGMIVTFFANFLIVCLK